MSTLSGSGTPVPVESYVGVGAGLPAQVDEKGNTVPIDPKEVDIPLGVPAGIFEQYKMIESRSQNTNHLFWSTPTLLLGAQAALLPVQFNRSVRPFARVLSGLLSCSVSFLSLQLLSRHRLHEKLDIEWLLFVERTYGLKQLHDKTESRLDYDNHDIWNLPWRGENVHRPTDILGKGSERFFRRWVNKIEIALCKIHSGDVWVLGIGIVTLASLFLTGRAARTIIIQRRWDNNLANKHMKIWMQNRGIPSWVFKLFKEHSIGHHNIKHVTNEVLKEDLGIQSFGERFQLLEAIRDWEKMEFNKSFSENVKKNKKNTL
eukprot:TRINITY_DN1746_c0_g1_i2.p1 TRINITY_DN1746_c0_g1~~TRINITY_DN1746_c0_g1_i2.p1  ORF type:complete len:317 (+),score=39.79 TRINITY_DN1746_c0_g1_i2:176-1126(+)